MSSSYLRLVTSEMSHLDEEEVSLQSLLNPFCPQPEITPGGKLYFAPDDVKRLDALFARFGLRLRSSDDAFDDTRYVLDLWYRLAENYGSYVMALAWRQKQAERMIARWPLPHQGYIDAVIRNDLDKACRFADLIQVEDLNAWAPKGYLARQD